MPLHRSSTDNVETANRPATALRAIDRHWLLIYKVLTARTDLRGPTYRLGSGAMSQHSDREQAGLELARLNRTLRLRSACTQVLIRAEEESQLLTAICTLAVEVAGYRMAWVGYAGQLPGSMRPMASAGATDDDLYLLCSAQPEAWASPASLSLRTAQISSNSDLRTSEPHPPWQAAALRHGDHAIICVPLLREDRAFGVLSLHDRDPHRASAEELSVLTALADDLAHSIHTLRTEAERKRLHLAALKIATLSVADGEQFLLAVSRELRELLEADAAFIGRLLPTATASVRCLALVTPTVEFAGIPVHVDQEVITRILSTGEAMLETDAYRELGELGSLAGWPAAAFAGVRLDHTAQQALGMIGVLYRDTPQLGELHLDSLRIFAVRVAAEITRQESNAVIRRHARMLDEAHDAILTTDAAGIITYCNDSARRRYGWSAPGLVGQSIDVLSCPQDLPASHQAFATALEEGSWAGEVCQRRLDGSSLPVESHLSRVHDADGGCSVLVISTDISQRRQAQRQLEQAMATLHERNRELREFAFIASHDLQEPLRKVRAYSERLIQRYAQQLDDRGQDYCNRMIGAVARMQRLIDDLLAYSRVLSGNRQQLRVPLREVIRGVLSDLEELLRETQAKVQYEELPTLLGDPTQLRQIFQNLIGNALKYRAAERQPQVTITARQVGEDPLGYWEIRVRDNGIGFSEEFAEQIFAPFQRLHGRTEYEGSGIGLAIVRRVIDSCGGSIRAQGTLGQGAEFILHWPLQPELRGGPYAATAAPARLPPAESSPPLPPSAAAPRPVVAEPCPSADAGLDELLAGIRAGRADAREQLLERYGRQIRVLLRHHRSLAPAQLEQLATEVSAALLQGVQTGQIGDSRMFAHDLRALLNRHYDRELFPSSPTQLPDAEARSRSTSVDPHRIPASVRALLAQSKDAIEQQILQRFFVQQQTAAQICRGLAIEPGVFRRTLSRLRRQVREALSSARPNSPTS